MNHIIKMLKTKTILSFIAAYFLLAGNLQAQGLHQTAKTKFLTVNGIKYAYRTYGQKSGLPLVLLPHFVGTMDDWDPSLTNELAKTHLVVIFDNKGVGGSGGETPSSITQMSEDAVAFIKALGYQKVDLLGFSMGGFIGQQIAIDHPGLLRRLILSGTAPRGGDIADNTPVIENKEKKTAEQMREFLFFTGTDNGIKESKAFWKRIQERKVDRDPDTKVPAILAQNKAIQDYTAEKDASFNAIKKITIPVLIVNGAHDRMDPPSNSLVMVTHMPNAKMIIYPDAGHGSLFQYSQDFAKQVNSFLK
ncbi:alpha/beta hydrolase [Mucilaginibacter sp. cycad4]|uniref:alpha/beta fold hydrolase n=1 Tax=Mucilaginibacter sp. cycad4 TaxID=3342096 RepID=UPI002AABB709|nr:alpha/beta hydrolase [Mucilaginibacter gossypii]WPU99058.1 alpha/beta hydrolase [Mucilaginibacter gossypii]